MFFKDGLSAACPRSEVFRFGLRGPTIASLLAITLCGCSFDLGPWSAQEKEATPQPAPAATSVSDAQSATSRGEALMRSGKTEEALAEFDKAIALDPHNVQALYNGGLLYQRDKQHQQPVADFTSANGLMPQRAEPLPARAISYLALDKVKEAAADLDEAVQADPQNAQAWTAKAEGQQKDGDAKKQDSASKDEDRTKKTDDRQRRTSPPRAWWETLNVDQNA